MLYCWDHSSWCLYTECTSFISWTKQSSWKALWSFQTSGSMEPTTKRTSQRAKASSSTTIRTSYITVSCCFKNTTVTPEANYDKHQPEQQDFRSQIHNLGHITWHHVPVRTWLTLRNFANLNAEIGNTHETASDKATGLLVKSELKTSWT